jgi:uncharacterized protein
MQLNLERNSGVFIRSFAPGELRVNDRVITAPVILTPDDILADWSPPPIDALSITDFATALAIRPELILFGTGVRHTFPSTGLVTDIMRTGVGFEAMATPAACRTFNVLAAEGRRVAAALLV